MLPFFKYCHIHELTSGKFNQMILAMFLRQAIIYFHRGLNLLDNGSLKYIDDTPDG